jgi:F-type H+-transporting ATPase subunit a
MTGVVGFLAADINVGTHVLRDGLDLDTIWSTLAAMVIVMAMGLYLRARATKAVPGKLQLAWEMGVQAVQQQVRGTIGPRGEAVVPLAVALFVFILVANWFSVLGIGSEIEWIGPPTSDINMTLALAFIVIVPVHIASVRNRGVVGYVKHYVSQPFPKPLFLVNIFINGVEEIAKPLTLALRLFGNLLSGGLMLALIAALGVWSISHVPIGDVATLVLNPVWKIFDLAIGAIQAFIFALLTILYFDTAMSDAH